MSKFSPWDWSFISVTKNQKITWLSPGHIFRITFANSSSFFLKKNKCLYFNYLIVRKTSKNYDSKVSWRKKNKYFIRTLLFRNNFLLFPVIILDLSGLNSNFPITNSTFRIRPRILMKKISEKWLILMLE